MYSCRMTGSAVALRAAARREKITRPVSVPGPYARPGRERFIAWS